MEGWVNEWGEGEWMMNLSLRASPKPSAPTMMVPPCPVPTPPSHCRTAVVRKVRNPNLAAEKTPSPKPFTRIAIASRKAWTGSPNRSQRSSGAPPTRRDGLPGQCDLDSSAT